MKKMIIPILSTLIIVTCIIVNNSKVINNNTEIKKDKTDNNLLSIMIETGLDSGEYKTSTSSTWPVGDYVFNTNRTYCKNDGKVTWDEETNSLTYNGNKSEKCYIYFDVEVPYSEVCDSNLLACHIAKYHNGTQGNKSIYYHNSALSNSAKDKSYRFSGPDFTLTEKATNAGLTKLISDDYTSTDAVIAFYCSNKLSYVGQSCTYTSKYYLLQYDTTNTKYSSYSEALNQAAKDGYITKDNVNNFVCFGSDATTCPEDNLYRIIGVFDTKSKDLKDKYHVKLIKWSYATTDMLGTDGEYTLAPDIFYSGIRTTKTSSLDGFNWNWYGGTSSSLTNGSNDWKTSKLNTINLNTNFINYLGTSWTDKIYNEDWKISGNNINGLNDTVTIYQGEIVNPSTAINSEPYNAKIGLMYASDYGYAASPEYWTTKTHRYEEYAIKSSNWLYNGMHEWTLTIYSDRTWYVLYIPHQGDIDWATANNQHGVRPSFYLNPSITFVSGSGTISDPIQVN